MVVSTSASSIVLQPGGLISWAIEGLLVRGKGYGCLGDMALGVIGAFIAGFILTFLPLHLAGTYGFYGTLVIAFLGALALAAVGRLIGGSRNRP